MSDMQRILGAQEFVLYETSKDVQVSSRMILGVTLINLKAGYLLITLITAYQQGRSVTGR